MIKAYVPDRYERVYWLSSRFSLILALGIGSYVALDVVDQLSLQHRLQAVNIIVSGLLTFALIAVYRDMSKIQDAQASEMSSQVALQNRVTEIEDQQTTILEEQTELESIQHTPSIHADRIRGVTDSYLDSSFFHLELSNTGKGVASDLTLYIEPSVETDGVHPLPTTHDLTRIRQTDEAWINTQTAYLKPGEDQIEFKSTAAMQQSNAASGDLAVFELVTGDLARAGIEQLELRLAIEYTTPSGERSRDKIFEHVLPIKGRTSLRAALQHGLPPDAPNLENRLESNRSEMDSDTGRQ